jgi:hypothetical protein
MAEFKHSGGMTAPSPLDIAIAQVLIKVVFYDPNIAGRSIDSTRSRLLRLTSARLRSLGSRWAFRIAWRMRSQAISSSVKGAPLGSLGAAPPGTIRLV